VCVSDVAPKSAGCPSTPSSRFLPGRWLSGLERPSHVKELHHIGTPRAASFSNLHCLTFDGSYGNAEL
jgi:hypothetical protein